MITSKGGWEAKVKDRDRKRKKPESVSTEMMLRSGKMTIARISWLSHLGKGKDGRESNHTNR